MLSAQSVIQAMGQELAKDYPDLISFIDQGMEEESEDGAWFLWIGVAQMDMLIVKLSANAEFTVSRFTNAHEVVIGHFTCPADAYREAYAAIADVLNEGYS